MSSTPKTYEFSAGMTCDGCKNAINRILTKLDGVTSVNADVDQKKVTVTGTASKELIEEKLTKWGNAANKEVKFVREVV